MFLRRDQQTSAIILLGPMFFIISIMKKNKALNLVMKFGFDKTPNNMKS